MSTFMLTGATGFIGGVLARQMLARGHKIKCLVRNRNLSRGLEQAGATIVHGDLASREAVREAMSGADGVFHLAAVYEIGVPDKAAMHKINVEGSRMVFELAGELKVPRVVYCSTVAALGNTGAAVADENWPHDGRFQSEYCRTKYLAHVEAKAQIQRGLPLIIAMPSVVYGPKDPSTLADTWRRYCQGKMPLLFAPDTRFTYVHVEDVVEGLILAYERGRIGESYILAEKVLTNREVLGLLAALTGRPMPRRRLPFALAKFIAIIDESVSALVGRRPLVSREGIRMLENCHWAASGEKARRELGWRPRPVEEGLRDVLPDLLPNK